MDAVCIGEMLVDFTPGQERDSYVKHAGGAPANVAVMLARNGVQSGFVGKLGHDDFGIFLAQTLQAEGVKLLCDPFTQEAVTTLAFVTLYENGERSFTFARKPGADMLLRPTDISEEEIQRCKVVHAGSVSLSEQPAREAVLYSMRLGKQCGKLVSFDINYRSALWDFETAKREVEKVLPYVDLLKISEEELGFVGGEAQISETMERFDISVVVQTLGGKGAKYYFRGGTGSIEGRRVNAVDATGAGDAFWGGFLAELLRLGITSRKELTVECLEVALHYGNCSGALCVQKKGGIPALPYRADVEQM